MTDPEQNSEAEWARRCGEGDKEAFGMFVRKYMKRAYFTALSFVGSHDDALDLSQEAFVRAFRAMDRFDPHQKFFTWYYRILRNLTMNHLRDNSRRTVDIDSVAGLLEDRDPGSSPERVLEREESRREIWAALWRLEVEDRELIVARDLLGTSYKTLAELLDCPDGTVMSRLFTARRRLREQLRGKL